MGEIHGKRADPGIRRLGGLCMDRLGAFYVEAVLSDNLSGAQLFGRYDWASDFWDDICWP